MADYKTLDFVPDLTFSQRLGATALPLVTEAANSGGYDVNGTVFRNGSHGEVFKITLNEGAVFRTIVTSFFSTNRGVTIHDEDGNAIDTVFASDYSGYVAPYTGTYYANVHWDPGLATTGVGFLIEVDHRQPGNIGNDNLTGSLVYAGPGNDSVTGTSGIDYLRGDEGDDVINGGDGFDDINGNQGNDTAAGGAGSDWVVGGQGNDSLAGEIGDDIVYGNLGNDTCTGGAGADWVRGGQGDDVLDGGSGNDFMSGDRGSDTIYGGSGADRFNLVAGAQIDRVMDFNSAEGDRVSIEGGLPYTLSFSGGNTTIDIGNGDQMILVGVASQGALGAWVFGT